MKFEILYRPAHSLARVWLEPGESVVAESGAMVGMSSHLELRTESRGTRSGLGRLLGGESFFRNTFVAREAPGELLLAHPLRGDMAVLEVRPQGYFLQSGSFIASTPNVELSTRVGGFKTFFAGEGLFVLQASCTSIGQLLVGAFGGIEQLDCDGTLVVDTGHLVAWDTSLDYSVGRSARGWIASFLSGEGLVCHFRGRGRIWIQSRNPVEYGNAVGRLLPPRPL